MLGTVFGISTITTKDADFVPMQVGWGGGEQVKTGRRHYDTLCHAM